MKYLAIVLLSVASLWITAGASQSMADRALAGVVGAALVGIQLRRRQKSLRMPRPLNY